MAQGSVMKHSVPKKDQQGLRTGEMASVTRGHEFSSVPEYPRKIVIQRPNEVGCIYSLLEAILTIPEFQDYVFSTGPRTNDVKPLRKTVRIFFLIAASLKNEKLE